MIKRVVESVDDSRNPWELIDHLDPHDSKVVGEYYYVIGGEDYGEFQAGLMKVLDRRFAEVCRFMAQRTGKVHDLLGPFNPPEFDEYLAKFSDPDAVMKDFFGYLGARLWITHRLDFGIPDPRRISQPQFNRAFPASSRDRLVLLASLNLHIPDQEFIFPWGKATIKQAADALWNELAQRGEVGWYAIPSEPPPGSSIMESMPQDEGESVPSTSSVQPNARVVTFLSELDQYNVPAKVRQLLMGLSISDNGSLIWETKDYDVKDLAFLIKKLFSGENALMYDRRALWKYGGSLFVVRREGGGITSAGDLSLHELSSRLSEARGGRPSGKMEGLFRST